MEGEQDDKATEAERKQGLDLADYLIRFDYRGFINHQSEQSEIEQVPAVQPLVEVSEIHQAPSVKETESLETIRKEKTESWEQDIIRLEQFYKTATLPNNPVRLSKCEVITDVWLFINSHLTTVKANNDKRTFLPYLNRLQDLKQYLTTNLN